MKWYFPDNENANVWSWNDDIRKSSSMTPRNTYDRRSWIFRWQTWMRHLFIVNSRKKAISTTWYPLYKYLRSVVVHTHMCDLLLHYTMCRVLEDLSLEHGNILIRILLNAVYSIKADRLMQVSRQVCQDSVRWKRCLTRLTWVSRGETGITLLIWGRDSADFSITRHPRPFLRGREIAQEWRVAKDMIPQLQK